MAISTATVGKVVIAGTTVGDVVNATLTLDTGNAETTQLSDTWGNVAATGKKWTLAMTCNYNNADTAQAALRTEYISGDCVLATVEAWVDATNYFIATAALISNFTLAKSVGGVDQLTTTIMGKAPLSYG
jgi:hypothetical protein